MTAPFREPRKNPFSLGLYTLDSRGNPVPCGNTLEWAAWFEKHEHRVLRQTHVGKVLVSTVFLGLDHFGFLWETMVFGGPHDQFQQRYKTREEALKGHRAAVAMVRKGK